VGGQHFDARKVSLSSLGFPFFYCKSIGLKYERPSTDHYVDFAFQGFFPVFPSPSLRFSLWKLKFNVQCLIICMKIKRKNISIKTVVKFYERTENARALSRVGGGREGGKWKNIEEERKKGS
jgi:hypothetical protein